MHTTYFYLGNTVVLLVTIGDGWESVPTIVSHDVDPPLPRPISFNIDVRVKLP